MKREEGGDAAFNQGPPATNGQCTFTDKPLQDILTSAEKITAARSNVEARSRTRWGQGRNERLVTLKNRLRFRPCSRISIKPGA